MVDVWDILPFEIDIRRIGNEGSTKGSTSGAGMAYPFEHPTSPTNVSGIRVLQCLVFCVLFQTIQWPIYTKGVIRSLRSKKERQYNGQKIPKE
jgi:hypothetical protein